MFLSETIRLNPNDSRAYGERGWYYFMLGEYAKALQDYDEAIRLDPEDEVYIQNRDYVISKINY